MQSRILQYTSLTLFLFLSFLFSCSQKPSENTGAQEKNPENAVSEDKKKTILFFGNSLTAGYGLEPEDAFTGIIQYKIDSLGLNYEVINAGLSGETTASGLNRLDWFLEEEPDIFVLELGGNDGLRGIAVSETRSNLEKIIHLVKAKHPDTHILLAGMQIPPNMGKEYASEFKNIFQELAEEEQVDLIPFLLEGVAGDTALNLPDGIHPNEAGHRIVAETVWEYLSPLLR
ncbi:MAG TPA: arylesterase [Cyclobacteriaceae bacterium]|nr:arylesterase [Cyclobacteriaceae bacterium]